MIGRATASALKGDGHHVIHLVRRPAGGPDEISWNPAAGEIPLAACRGYDAVINLCGSPIAGGRWTAKRQGELRSSRIDSTQTVAKLFAEGAEGQPKVLINASAVGIYGDRGNLELTESSVPGDGFLSRLCRDWEDAAQAAGSTGARIVCLRLGIVLSHEGGALQQMIPFYRAGLGCPLGTGRQWMSWITLEDAVGVIRLALSQESLSGPMNVVSPNSVTNAGFTRALGRIFGRQLNMPVPRTFLRMAYGAITDEALLASAHVVPLKLIKAKYPYRYPNLEDALYQALAMEKAEG
jgi:uncharacterized protein (TIGR01777 family)